MIKKILLLSVLISLTFSCGKKGPLEKPTTYKRPNFDNVIDE